MTTPSNEPDFPAFPSGQGGWHTDDPTNGMSKRDVAQVVFIAALLHRDGYDPDGAVHDGMKAASLWFAAREGGQG